MYPGRLVSVVEVRRDDLLAIAVRKEVDGSCRDDADECWTEALEQRAGRLLNIDVPVYTAYDAFDDSAREAGR